MAALLIGWILGGAVWVVTAIGFFIGVVLSGEVPAIGPHFWWLDVLAMSVVFLGLPGWILALAAWRKTRRGRSGFKQGVTGGIIMTLTGMMLLPGVLSIIGAVLSRPKPAGQSVAAETEQQP